MVTDERLAGSDYSIEATDEGSIGEWNTATRVVYRVVCLYVFIYSLFGLWYVCQATYWHLTKHYLYSCETALRNVVPWLGRIIFHVTWPANKRIGGDSPFLWVEDFFFLLCSVVGGAIWSVLDRKRKNYRTLDQWLHLWVRFALAIILFFYGFAKVYPLQFHFLTRSDLVAPLGSFSQYDLMWHFMAASKGYTIFGGVLEVLAGVMLLVPGLTELGALLAVAVFGNVVALNIFYNIPVKLYSSNYLLLSVFLIAPQLPRLFQLLVLNKAVEPETKTSLSSRPGVDIGVRVVLAALGTALFFWFGLSCRAGYAGVLEAAQASAPLQGIWEVEGFTAEGSPQSGLFTTNQVEALHLHTWEEPWSRLIFDVPNVLTIQTVSGVQHDVDLKLSGDQSTADLVDESDVQWKGHLSLAQPQAGQMSLQGEVNGMKVKATLHRLDEAQFPLSDQTIHFVQWP